MPQWIMPDDDLYQRALRDKVHVKAIKLFLKHSLRTLLSECFASVLRSDDSTGFAARHNQISRHALDPSQKIFNRFDRDDVSSRNSHKQQSALSFKFESKRILSNAKNKIEGRDSQRNLIASHSQLSCS